MRVSISVLAVHMGSLLCSAASAQSIGLVTDLATHKAVLFDADSYQTLGSVALPTPQDGCFGDCVITADQQLAFVSGFTDGVFVIDVSTRPPTPAAGINLIPTTRVAYDLDLTPDGLFLIASGQMVMTIDPVLRTEVATFDQLGSVGAIDASLPGSVLIGQPQGLSLRRL